MSTSIPSNAVEQITQAILSGNKIEAIKLYREQNNVGLKEAKDAVDKMEAELRSASPDKFSVTKASGCLGVMTLVIGMLGCIPLVIAALK